MREKMEHVKHAAEQKMWKVQAVLADQQHYINVYDIDSG